MSTKPKLSATNGASSIPGGWLDFVYLTIIENKKDHTIGFGGVIANLVWGVYPILFHLMIHPLKNLLSIPAVGPFFIVKEAKILLAMDA